SLSSFGSDGDRCLFESSSLVRRERERRCQQAHRVPVRAAPLALFQGTNAARAQPRLFRELLLRETSLPSVTFELFGEGQTAVSHCALPRCRRQTELHNRRTDGTTAATDLD